MHIKLITMLIGLLSLNFCSKELSAQDLNYELGNNYDFVFGLDLLNTFQINPKATGGENKFDLGTKLDFEFVNFDLKSIFEFRTLVDLNAQKVDTIDWKKNVDRFELSLKYGVKPKYGSKLYYSSDMSIRTQILNSYTDDFLKDNDTRRIISSFLSPANITVSLGLEYRPKDQATYFYFSPLALNTKYVRNDSLSMRIVQNNKGEDLGTLHGNKIGTNNRTNIGAQFKVRFDFANENQTILWDTYLDVFLAYAEFDTVGEFSPVQAEWVNSITFRIWKPIVLSIDTRTTYDPDLLFVDTTERNVYSDKERYNMINRILLSFSTKYFIGR